jgi:hypothetical protein
MFSQTIQPPLISLFSSVGSSPLSSLWATQSDPKLPEDSFICVVDDSSSEPSMPDNKAVLAALPKEYEGGLGKQLNCAVLHIQSPTIPTTYILAPPTGELSLTHPWIHLQLRNLHKEFSFEIGIVDSARRRGRIRWSSFQQSPRIYVGNSNSGSVVDTGPLLHVPLTFPAPTSRPLTAWCTLDVHIPPLLAHFSSDSLYTSAVQSSTTAIPTGTFQSISYIKIHANCRLRRVWVSQGRGTSRGSRDGWPEEFQLYEGGA